MKNAKRKTTAPLEARTVTPEFIRLPKPGSTCPHCGLTRSYLNTLILPNEANNFRPPVKSVSLRQEGQTKGVRLIVFSSLMAYLRSHEVAA